MRVMIRVLAVLVLIGCAGSARAAILLGKGSLYAEDDLTVVANGARIFEFLDLTYTIDSTIEQALAAYSGDGFAFAHEGHIRVLLDAFGSTYQFRPNGVASLGASLTSRSAFVDHLGDTLSGSEVGSLGWFTAGQYSANQHPYTYLCMSVDGGCSPDSFVNNGFTPPGPATGVFLVRNGIPIPGTFALFSIAFMGFAWSRHLHRAAGRHQAKVQRV